MNEVREAGGHWFVEIPELGPCQSTPMYRRHIAAYIGEQPPEAMAAIEELMRLGSGGVLDHLSPAKFRREARLCLAAWEEIQRDHDRA